MRRLRPQSFIIILMIALLFGAFSPIRAYAYHAEFDGLLQDYVVPSEYEGIRYLGVDYDAWAKDPRHKQAMRKLLAMNPDNFISEEAKMAFWINAYNLMTIDFIIRSGERESITNLGDTLKSPWNTYKWKVAGKEHTLDRIKNDILLAMGDPRVLFALNSGTVSCPDLRREAYRPARLESQLRDQVSVTFKNQTKGIKFDGDVVRVPKYMEWDKSKFAGGNLKSWLQGYYPEYIDGDTEVGFFQYNWALNKVRPD